MNETTLNIRRFKAGDRVRFERYGVQYAGVVVNNPRGNTLVIREDGRVGNSWMLAESCERMEPDSHCGDDP